MAAYFSLNDNKISKEILVNTLKMILDNQSRLALNDQGIISPHNELQKSFGFVSLHNTVAVNNSGEFGLEETSLALSTPSSNAKLDSGDNEATIGTSLQWTSKEFDRETFLTGLPKFSSIGVKIIPTTNRET